MMAMLRPNYNAQSRHNSYLCSNKNIIKFKFPLKFTLKNFWLTFNQFIVDKHQNLEKKISGMRISIKIYVKKLSGKFNSSIHNKKNIDSWLKKHQNLEKTILLTLHFQSTRMVTGGHWWPKGVFIWLSQQLFTD